MKTIVSCLMLAMTFSYLSSSEETQHAAPPDKESPSVIIKQHENVILLSTKEVSDMDMVDKVQESYIKKLYPGYRVILSFGIISRDGIVSQDSTISPDDRYIECVTSINKGFEDCVSVSFDMTDVYKYFRQKDEQSRKAIEKREEMYINIVK